MGYVMRTNDILLIFAVLVIIFFASLSTIVYLENQDLKEEIAGIEDELQEAVKAKEKAELKANEAASIADQVSQGRVNSRIIGEESCEAAGGRWEECPSLMELPMPDGDVTQTICSPPGCILPEIGVGGK